MRIYFVTGATGAIGSALVPLLLQIPDTEVRLLLRARDAGHLVERLNMLRDYWGWGGDDSRMKRVRAFRGDVSQPCFGFTVADYQTLAAECTHVIHCAGNVRMNLALEEARRNSLDSARNITGFARECQKTGRFEKVEFVSTVGVAGRKPGLVPETWITTERAFHNTYEEAKAEAEVVVAREVVAGLPLTVHRPSMVVGDSVTGRIIHFQIFYHLCEFLSGKRTFGIIPRLAGHRLDIIPVDYVARALAWSSGEGATTGKVIHLCSGPEHAIDLAVLSASVREAFRRGGEKLPGAINFPLPLFKSAIPLVRMFVPDKIKRALDTLPFFFAYLEERQLFANAQSVAILEHAGIALPNLASYLPQVLEYYSLKRGR